MTTLGKIDKEHGTFCVHMAPIDKHFVDTVRRVIPVCDREWHPDSKTWTFVIRHLDTIKRILEFPQDATH
jgi:hypothetical protein